ncbi:restriction endonuclease [Desulfogranum marinum]|uniref:restriction endonuclease n=1 Tax=Desulfogranum marinum TaxID=453220 RepID=UPI001E2C2744|nr:restriction endonuclease [Desulfogranum marinum]
MARRRQSGLDILVEIVSYFHWGIGVALAISAYLFLHWYAGQELYVAKDMSEISSGMLSGVFHGLAGAGQYLFPVVLLFAAATSFFNRRKRHNLYETTQASSSVNPLDNMSWQEFEMLVGEHFRREGYGVSETADGADGGVDLVLKIDGATYFVQCKQWKAYKVGVKTVRELLGVMTSRGAAGGYVVTSGRFTVDAEKFALENNVQLIDGAQLKRIITKTPPPQPWTQVQDTPLCPKCGSEMIKRVAKKGSRAGKQFWGCSNFPKCRGTISID